MTNNTYTPDRRTPLNRRLFDCIDRELYAPISMPGSAYFPNETLFEDEHGNQDTMLDIYIHQLRLVCPMHEDQRILCRPYDEYASSLGFYCPECETSYWSLSAREIPCRECGVAVNHGFLGQYGICAQCDASDDSGLDLSAMEVTL